MSEEEVEETPAEEFVTAAIQAEFYLKGREMPVQSFPVYRIHKSHLDKGEEVQDFMNLSLSTLLQSIDTVGMHRLVMTDGRSNKQVVMIDEVQAISLLAPDKETILGQLD